MAEAASLKLEAFFGLSSGASSSDKLEELLGDCQPLEVPDACFEASANMDGLAELFGLDNCGVEEVKEIEISVFQMQGIQKFPRAWQSMAAQSRWNKWRAKEAKAFEAKRRGMASAWDLVPKRFGDLAESVESSQQEIREAVRTHANTHRMPCNSKV